MRIFILWTLASVCSAISLSAQPGCTDPQAVNFDPNATSNDGSCAYPVTNYSLVLKTNLSTTLNETSGLVMAGGSLWTHNDSGDQPRIFKIDTLSNSILQTVTIGGATHVDWEDITFDGSNFYVGDFGNNANGNRTDLKIYKFPLSAIPSGSNVTVPAGQVQVINFSYEDQTDFTPQGPNNTSFDCESIIYHDDMLHLFTKDYINQTTTHYLLPTDAGTYDASNQESYDVNGLITAADITSYGVIVLLGYEANNGSIFFWLLFDYQPGIYFSGNKRRIELGPKNGSGQVEGIAFRNSKYGYVSNERFTSGNTVPARLYSFRINQWLQPIFFPVELVRFNARATPSGALLEWETATERDNLGFAVERSGDGLFYKKIGFVPGAGDSQTPLSYRFTDPQSSGVRYYRLRQQDFDGSEHLSPAVVVYGTENTVCQSIAPNPLPAGEPILLPAESQILISDQLGRTFWQGNSEQWSRPALTQGVYYLQVWGEGSGQFCTAMLMVR